MRAGALMWLSAVWLQHVFMPSLTLGERKCTGGDQSASRIKSSHFLPSTKFFLFFFFYFILFLLSMCVLGPLIGRCVMNSARLSLRTGASQLTTPLCVRARRSHLKWQRGSEAASCDAGRAQSCSGCLSWKAFAGRVWRTSHTGDISREGGCAHVTGCGRFRLYQSIRGLHLSIGSYGFFCFRFFFFVCFFFKSPATGSF